MILRATLDNVPNAIPVETMFIDSMPALQTSGASFVFPNVAPGARVLRLQYRSTSGGAVLFLKSNTIMHYAP